MYAFGYPPPLPLGAYVLYGWSPTENADDGGKGCLNFETFADIRTSWMAPYTVSMYPHVIYYKIYLLG